MPLVEPLLIKKSFVKREFPDSSYIIKCCFSISDVNALRLELAIPRVELFERRLVQIPE